MRKLMIAAAAAALAAGAFADAQVYEMTLTVKTTACNTKHKSIANPCVEGETIIYRQQVTRKYQGLFWGCECQVIACPDGYFAGVESQDNRYLFWSATKGFQFRLEGDDYAFKWDLLQVVGPKSANVEGAWTLVLKNTDGKEVLNVAGAGYGSAKNVCSANAQIKSMSGYVTGINDIDNEGAIYGCYYCGDEIDCEAVQFCPACTDGFDSAKTAVFGSWTLKFNSSAANKLAKGNGTTIDKAYKFPKYVNLENTGNTPDPTTTTAAAKAKKAYDEAKAAVTTAETAVATAQAGLEDLAEVNADGTFKAYKDPAKTTKGKELAAAEKTAKRDVDDAVEDVNDATDKVNTAKKALDDETVSGADKLGAAYTAKQADVIAAQDAIDAQQKIIDESTDAAAIAAAKDKIKAGSVLQNNLENAKTALANVQKKINALDAEKKTEIDKLISAYDTAITDLDAANKAKDAADKKYKEAQDATKLWVETGDEKKEGTIAKAKADAEKAVKSANDALNKANSELASYRAACIATGATCD